MAVGVVGDGICIIVFFLDVFLHGTLSSCVRLYIHEHVPSPPTGKLRLAGPKMEEESGGSWRVKKPKQESPWMSSAEYTAS
jgi:hypothetical protein